MMTKKWLQLQFPENKTIPSRTCYSQKPVPRTFSIWLAIFCALASSQLLFAQKETVLHNFGSFGDGAHPNAGLVIDKQGNLYGTTNLGGRFSGGIVFEVAPTGGETVLYSFGGFGPDGINPVAGPVMGKSGNLYGTTSNGGANASGAVFELTPSLTETVLYSFANDGKDGVVPFAGLVLDAQGNLYGTT